MRYFIAGGCGFIGSEMAKKLLQNEENEVVIYDNLSSGSLDLVKDIANDRRVSIIIGDVKDLQKLTESMKSCDIVFHFCSNANISAHIENPTIDFYEGTLLTQNILEAMRANRIKKIAYASGSGVYGRVKHQSVSEGFCSMQPVSTYGASKIAGEALICSYCWMFDMDAVVYRFANVIGRHSTHGVILDFINKLKKQPASLEILGSGNQTKGYMHVDDILEGIYATQDSFDKPFDCFNLAPDNHVTVRRIANMVAEEMGLRNVEYVYKTSSDSIDGGGWRGDVATIKMNSDKARSYGWTPTYTSEQAVRKSIREMLGKE